MEALAVIFQTLAFGTLTPSLVENHLRIGLSIMTLLQDVEAVSAGTILRTYLSMRETLAVPGLASGLGALAFEGLAC